MTASEEGRGHGATGHGLLTPLIAMSRLRPTFLYKKKFQEGIGSAIILSIALFFFFF